MQRLRLKFSRGEELKFLSHLDLMRLWERACRRAGLPLAYSEGFTPHPRLALAAPLSVGITSEAEVMDIFLLDWTPPHAFISRAREQLPQGLYLNDAGAVGLNAPSLQSQMRFAEYRVKVDADRGEQEIELSIRSLLSAKNLPWHHFRDTGVRHYDIRPLIDNVWLIDHGGNSCVLGMRLRCDASGAGRPEQVAKALGFARHPVSIHRTRLILD